MKKSNRFFLSILGAILLLSISLAWMEHAQAPVQSPSQTIELIGPDGARHTIPVEVADDASERETGLMFRQTLMPATGMLFVFPEPQELSFWMKNTVIPLDIMYFDADGVFVSRSTMAPCEKDPCENYPSRGKSLYALEVNKGEQETNDVGNRWFLIPPQNAE